MCSVLLRKSIIDIKLYGVCSGAGVVIMEVIGKVKVADGAFNILEVISEYLSLLLIFEFSPRMTL